MKKMIVFAGLFLVGVACGSDDNTATIEESNIQVEQRCGCADLGYTSGESVLVKVELDSNNPNRAPEHRYELLFTKDGIMVRTYFVCNDDLIDKKFPLLELGTEIPVRFSGQILALCEEQGFFYPAIYAYFFVKVENIEAL
ncbi:hypothetical protein [Flavobacterium sp. JP2137]|uniref:hypothetical protein n=1 Tax=Flavobacterium sp. JP2137 TaxID=3414510 RepID=UPI003D2FDCC7